MDDRRGNLQCTDNFVSLDSQKVMRNSIALELVNKTTKLIFFFFFFLLEVACIRYMMLNSSHGLPQKRSNCSYAFTLSLVAEVNLNLMYAQSRTNWPTQLIQRSAMSQKWNEKKKNISHVTQNSAISYWSIQTRALKIEKSFGSLTYVNTCKVIDYKHMQPMAISCHYLIYLLLRTCWPSSID